MAEPELKTVPLADAVAKLRTELMDAIAAKPKTGVSFEVEKVQLELQVVAETTEAGKLTGGWSILGWSIGAEAQLGASHAGTHKVSLSLLPVEVLPDGTRRKADINALTTDDR